MEAWLEYKCRRCDKRYSDTNYPSAEGAAIQITGVLNGELRQGDRGSPLYRLHECTDGGRGVADLLGYIVRENERVSVNVVKNAMGEIRVQRGQVVHTAEGRNYVAGREHALPEGAKIIANRPHEDGDMSYTCGNDFCRCMQ